MSHCVDSDGDGTAIFSGPLGMTIDHTGTYAYVGNISGNTVSSCTIVPTTGKLTNCINNSFGFNAPIGVTINSLGNRVYVANTGLGEIFLCSINPADGTFTSSINADGDGSAIFNGPALMSLTAAGTRMYISDNGFGTGDSVSECSVNLITGKLYNCGDSGVGPIFFSPAAVTLNTLNSKIYISNNGTGSAGTTVSLCQINSSIGKLTSCADADGDGTAVFSGPAGVSLLR
jgi:DNA-binding beta-propeller fold protein YncE